MSTKGKQVVYQRRTEGVYQTENGCLPEGRQEDRKSTSGRQRVFYWRKTDCIAKEERVSTEGR